MPRAHRALAVGLTFLAEAVRICRSQDVQVAPGGAAELPPTSLNQAKTLPQDVSPGVMQWILAVILSAILVSGLVRVYRVLRKGENMPLIRAAPEGMRPVQCGACRTVQYATSQGRIFICFSCRSANRLPTDVPLLHSSDLVEHTGPLRSFEFKKGGENFWQELKVETLAEDATPPQAVQLPPAVNTVAEADDTIVPVTFGRQMESEDEEAGQGENQGSVADGNELGVPQCVVCLDSPGNMVLLPCAHGGVCEECATRIAQNRASGGAHCPHCRSQIQTLVKIHEIEGDLAKGIEYRIPMARHV